MLGGFSLDLDLEGSVSVSVFVSRPNVSGPIYKISYDNLTKIRLSDDNAKVTVDSRRTSNLQNV